MTTPAELPPQAGWYDDPASPGDQRWWTGIAWAEHTQPAVSPSVSRAVTKGRWGAGSIVSIVLALVLFVVLAIWLSPWWLALPAVIFLVRWLAVDRGGLLRSAQAVPADPVRDARVVEHVRTASARMGIEAPEVYVSPQPVRNAFALTDRRGALVCVYQGTLDALDDTELAAVLTHEVGHIKNRDSLYMAFFDSVRMSLTALFFFLAAIMAIAIAFLARGRSAALAGLFGSGIMLVGSAVAFLLIMAGQRSREYGADRLCAETHPDPLALGRALIKLEESPEHLEIGQIPITVAARCIVPPFASSFMSEIVGSHPSTAKRVARIERLLGAARVAESRRAAAIDAWALEAEGLRRTLDLATAGAPSALGANPPFTPVPAEALWIECPAKLASPRSVRGERGLHVGESGRLIVTTERVVFVGAAGRVEWRWSKLHDFSRIGRIDGGEVLVLAVANRQRNSGVWVEQAIADEVGSWIELAIADHRGQRPALIARLQAALSAHEAHLPPLLGAHDGVRET